MQLLSVLLLYVSVVGLAVVEGQARDSPPSHLCHRQLLRRALLKPPHPPSVSVGGPRHLTGTHKIRTYQDQIFFFFTF